MISASLLTMWLLTAFAATTVVSASACGSSCYGDRICFDPTGGKGPPGGTAPICPGRADAGPRVEKQLFLSMELCSVDSEATVVLDELHPVLCCYGPGVDDCYEPSNRTAPCGSADEASVILKKEIPAGTLPDRHSRPQSYQCCYQVSVKDNGLPGAHGGRSGSVSRAPSRRPRRQGRVHVMVRRALVTTAVLVALTSCSGSDKDAPPPPSAALVAACDGMAEALCGRAATCAPFLFQGAYGDAQSCLSFGRSFCSQWLPLPGVTRDVSVLKRCADAW